MMTVVFFAHFTAIPAYSTTVLGTDGATAGFIAGVFIVGDVIGRLLLGNRLWSLGPSRVCFIAMALGTVISAFYFLTTDIALLCIIGALQGFTYGVAELSVFTFVSNNLPPKRRGEGLGYFTLNYSLASAIGPLMSIYMINNGLFTEIFWLGLIASGLSALFAAMMGRGNKIEEGTVSDMPDMDPEAVIRKAIPISLVLLVFLTSYTSVLTFIAPYGIEIGLKDFTVFFYVAFSVGTVISRVRIIGIYDTRGPDVILVPMFVLYIAAMVMLALIPTGITLMISAFLIGLMIGTMNTIAQVMAIEGVPPNRHGTGLAVAQTCIDGSYIIGPVIAGAICTLSGYSMCYLAMAGIGAVSMAMYILMCSHILHRKGPVGSGSS